MRANSGLVLEVAANEFLVHDRHLLCRCRIVVVEYSTSVEPDAKCLEVLGSDHLIMRGWAVGFLRPGPAQDLESLANVPSFRRKTLAEGNGAHAWQRGYFFLYFVIEDKSVFRLRIMAERQA